MKELEDTIKRYEAIARKNDDEFSFVIRIERSRRPNKPLEFCFDVVETCDGHSFSTGFGDSIELAVQNALSGLKDNLETWGYSE